MSSYNRMLETLKPLGIYKLDGTTILDCELKSYAVYIDIISDKIDQMFNRIFLDNVTGDSIVRYAKLYSLPASVTKELLKDIVVRRNRISNTDFTVDGVMRCLKAGGITADLSENFATNTVTVTITDDKKIFTDIAQRNTFIKQVLPCHVKSNIK